MALLASARGEKLRTKTENIIVATKSSNAK